MSSRMASLSTRSSRKDDMSALTSAAPGQWHGNAAQHNARFDLCPNYRGSAPALTDLLVGQVQVMFDAMPSSIEHIRAGRLRPLAVTTAMRSEVSPDVPTVGDFLPGFEAST